MFNKIRQLCSGSPICLITSTAVQHCMITDSIRGHEGLIMISNKKLLIITFAKEKKKRKGKRSTHGQLYNYMSQCFCINCDYINLLLFDK